jgi:Cytosine deaminase and related metal-dependent hydrolases
MYDVGINQAIILSSQNEYQPFIGSLGIQNGRIALISTEPIEAENCLKMIDATGKILMPGLFNGHCHGDMTLARGLGDNRTLWEQNKEFASHNWFEKWITKEDRYYARQLTYAEALLSGTTFIMENMYWGLGTDSIKAMREVGIRGALAEDIREDFAKPDTFLSEETIQTFIKNCEEHQLIPVLGSISEEDYEEKRLLDIETIRSTHKMMMTCHLAENDWRVEHIREKYGMTPIAFLEKQGVLSPYNIASHVVYATNEDIAFLKKTNTKVVNTPLCEMKIADGVAPIPEMVRQGVVVSLGTDGALWNNSNDIFREMKGMSLLHSLTSGVRSLSKKDILNMATINGAKTFGLEKECGSIEVGKRADFILIETRVPHMRPLLLGKHETVTSHIIHNATGQDVTDVFVNGEQVVQNKKLLTVDIETVINKVQNTAEKIAEALSL